MAKRHVRARVKLSKLTAMLRDFSQRFIADLCSVFNPRRAGVLFIPRRAAGELFIAPRTSGTIGPNFTNKTAFDSTG